MKTHVLTFHQIYLELPFISTTSIFIFIFLGYSHRIDEKYTLLKENFYKEDFLLFTNVSDLSLISSFFPSLSTHSSFLSTPQLRILA